MPLIELKPNRLASGLSFQLLELEGDLRYPFLFILALVAIGAALASRSATRGWTLAGLGNALLFLTLFLPAVAGQNLIDNASDLLDENVRVSNPRLLPSGALVVGLIGSYVVLYGGLRDLIAAEASRAARFIAAWGGVALVVLGFVTGQFDVYSVMVELESRGEQLGQRTIEHIMFVGVSLVIGFVVGVGLGLWAHRDERSSPIVLYAVGIIQTIPSLALFGVLLEPLARLGGQRALSVGLFFIISLAVAAALIFAYRRFAAALSENVRQVFLILSAIVAAVPLALFTVVLASFLFRVSLVTFTSDAGLLPTLRTVMLVSLIVGFALWISLRYFKGTAKRVVRYGAWLGYGVFATALLVALVGGSNQFLGNVGAGLTMRNLGVSGIGTAPAVIALTLYSLLPLVRNTFAGLSNVDAAIVDSGRGMGMNAGQRFFQIELPIALPVIMAGVRNAAIALVGIGTVATIIGAGGLGDFIIGGVVNTSIDQILLGAVPAVLLAVALDAALRGLERLMVSPGIQQMQD